jgi:hypothetical protein
MAQTAAPANAAGPSAAPSNATGSGTPATKDAKPDVKSEASGAPAAKMPNQYTREEKAQARANRQKDVSKQNKAGKLPKGGEM